MAIKRLLTMRKALANPQIFGAILAGDSWAAWRILLIAAMGEPLRPDELRIFTELTGRDRSPTEQIEEAYFVVGRRGGKTRASAVLASYLATLIDYKDILAPGERASIMAISASLYQAKKIHQYLTGIFSEVQVMKNLLSKDITADTISLKNRIDLECRPASFRTTRGATLAAVICDELAFWRSDESANPDTEILNALRPSLATTGGPLIAISSPYSRKGELWENYKAHYGNETDPLILVAQAASRTTNPSLSQKVVDRAYSRDPAAAAAEYGAQFRNDLEAFISREIVDAITVSGRFEIPRLPGTCYSAFVDTSGGSGDDMVLAIAHKEGDMAILDCLRVVSPPFNPDEVTRQFAETLRSYGVHQLRGDRYGGVWPIERFQTHGIEYLVSDKTKNEIYQQGLPLLMGRRVELLDHTKLRTQLVCLERKTSSAGRDIIDHPKGAHDDCANAAIGALVNATGFSGDFNLETFIRAWGSKTTVAAWQRGER